LKKKYNNCPNCKFGIRNVDNTSDTNVSFERYDCVKGLRCNDFSDKDCNDFKEGTYEFGFGCTKLFLIAIVLAFVIYVIIDNIKTKN